MMEPDSTTTVVVDCPYCGEPVEILVEGDLLGEMVRDCDVCCHPWRLIVRREGADRRVEVFRLDD